MLDTRRTKDTGKYPVKLRITFLREQKYYSIGLDLTVDEFNLVQNPGKMGREIPTSLKKQVKEWKLKCDAVEQKANTLINKMEDFTFRIFEKKYLQNSHSVMDVYQLYDNTIKKLKDYGKVGTASSYECARNSLKEFSPKLTLRDITVDFLKEYERWFLEKKRSITTVGIYLRNLRAIINEAIAEGIISREYHYPFGKRKYQIPSARNTKKALTLEEISKIFSYTATNHTWLERARDFFIFSYLGNGMNMKDIALLKYRDIDGDYIRFTRAKTQDTSRTGIKMISFHISDDLRQIIDRQKNESTGPDSFLFPILEQDQSPEKVRKVIQQFTKMMNKYLNQIATELGINKRVTTYFARHSFATVLKRGGRSIEIISEALGHSSHKTTMSYLDSFDDESKKDIYKTLTNFREDGEESHDQDVISEEELS
ncbi:MAG: site-specific integrase [Sphingobacteriales bacterium]|nr:site-specific integrase [Sphingobacteriales bacterium]